MGPPLPLWLETMWVVSGIPAIQTNCTKFGLEFCDVPMISKKAVVLLSAALRRQGDIANDQQSRFGRKENMGCFGLSWSATVETARRLASMHTGQSIRSRRPPSLCLNSTWVHTFKGNPYSLLRDALLENVDGRIPFAKWSSSLHFLFYSILFFSPLIAANVQIVADHASPFSFVGDLFCINTI